MRPLPAALALFVVARTFVAQAQPSPDEVARIDLLRQAEQARDAGDHARSLDLATRAGRLRMTPSLQLLIAQESDRVGRVVDAYGSALACQRAAEVDATLRNRESILGTCRALTETIRARVGSVRVRFATTPPELALRIAGAEVSAATRELPRVVAPGAVSVEVEAPGYLPWRRTVAVAAGGVAEVAVTLVSVGASQGDPSARRGATGPWPYVVAGVGVASFVAAGVLYGYASDARGERDALCNARGCFPDSRDHNARYEDLVLGTNVALGVGGALVVGGALWWILARTRGATDRPAATQVTPMVLAHGAGITLGGAL